MVRVNRDSELWRRAYKAKKKSDVKVYQVKQKPLVKTDKPGFVFTKSDKDLNNKLAELNSKIASLKQEQTLVVREIKKRRQIKNRGIERKVSLYALRLQNDCWYVGMSFNVQKRFTKHQKGKGAIWTKKYEPIEIHEIRVTEHFDQDSAVKLEDDMTLEYALKYGSDKVRGGGWCQTKPHWPDVIIQNELIV